jgi:hypothetical protein
MLLYLGKISATIHPMKTFQLSVLLFVALVSACELGNGHSFTVSIGLFLALLVSSLLIYSEASSK